MDYQQLDLFSNADRGIKPTRLTPRAPQWVMDAEALTTWKIPIASHQQQARTIQPPTQGTLFELSTPSSDWSDSHAPARLLAMVGSGGGLSILYRGRNRPLI